MADYLIPGSEYLAQFPGFKLVGRDAELKRLTAILMRSRASSVLLTGPGGVGLTSICLGLQVAKSQPDAPFDIARRRMFWLDVNTLFGNENNAADSFLKAIARVEAIPGSILLVEDARDLIEACRNAGSMHLINALFAKVRSKALQVILESREDDLEQVFQSSPEIEELLTVLSIDEPTGEALEDMVRSSVDVLVAHHGIRVQDDAILKAIEYTTKYRPKDGGLSRAQPERALTLIDRALSSYRLSAHSDPRFSEFQGQLQRLYADRRDGQNAVDAIEKEIEEKQATESVATTDAVSPMQSSEMAALRRRLMQYQALLAENLTQAQQLEASINAELALTSDHITAEFSAISGISADKLNENDLERLRQLPANLNDRVYGQEEVVKRVSNGARVFRIGRRGTMPLPYLFLGPSGVGKTELGRALQQYLFGDETGMLRLDMSEYMEKHAVARMIGAPPGYEGFAAGGILTNAIRKNNYRVVMLDEIEKAHDDVFNIMLQVLDPGRLTDGLGRTADFENTVIVMTTNIGQQHFLNRNLTWDQATDAALADLSGRYRNEFLNRFAGKQNILCFKLLDNNAMCRIVRREINAIDLTYSRHHIHTQMDDTDIERLCAQVYNPDNGARGLPGYLRAELEPYLVNQVLEEPNFRGLAKATFASGFHVDFEIREAA